MNRFPNRFQRGVEYLQKRKPTGFKWRKRETSQICSGRVTQIIPSPTHPHFRRRNEHRNTRQESEWRQTVLLTPHYSIYCYISPVAIQLNPSIERAYSPIVRVIDSVIPFIEVFFIATLIPKFVLGAKTKPTIDNFLIFGTQSTFWSTIRHTN